MLICIFCHIPFKDLCNSHLTLISVYLLIFFLNLDPHDLQVLPLTLKICFITGGLLGMTVQFVYSSCILSSITVLKSPIKSFDDLIDYGFTSSTHNRSVAMQTILMVILHIFANIYFLAMQMLTPLWQNNYCKRTYANNSSIFF